MLLAVVIWIFCGIGASIVAQGRGANGCLWFGLGVLFGPFGLAFAFASGSDRRCHLCRERIHPEAVRCPRCQADLSAPASDGEDERLNRLITAYSAAGTPECALNDFKSRAGGPLSNASAITSTPANAPNSIRYCNHCGSAVPHNAKFCNECGGQIIRALGEAHA